MKKYYFKILLFLLVLGVFVYYITDNFDTIQHTLNVTLSQSVGYLFVAIVLFAFAYALMSMMNKTIFDMMKIRRTLWEMIILQMQSLTVNVLIPSAGISVGIMFADDAKERGESGTAAVTAIMLALLLDYSSIATMITVAMVYILLRGSLSPLIYIPAVALYALSFGIFLLIFLSGRNKSFLRKFLVLARKIFNGVTGIFKIKPFGGGSAIDDFIQELTNTYNAVRSNKAGLYRAFGYMLGSRTVHLVAIYIIFISLGITPFFSVVLSGYAIGMMFAVISPTPNGVGFVEGSMAFAYTTMGVPGAAAATVTLIYRGFSFWLPLLIGFFALQRKHLLSLIRMQRDKSFDSDFTDKLE